MGGDLNMNNKKIIHLRQPTSDTDAATKKYVDNNKIDLSKKGKIEMKGDLDLNNFKILNLKYNPTIESDAVNKHYVDTEISRSYIQPSHQKNEFGYLMSNILQWTDEMDGGDSFNMSKIADLSPSQGNFHTYNRKVIYTTIKKNSQGGYKFKKEN